MVGIEIKTAKMLKNQRSAAELRSAKARATVGVYKLWKLMNSPTNKRLNIATDPR